MRDGQVGEEEKGRVNDSMAATHATATVGLESLADEGDGTLVWLAFRRVETRSDEPTDGWMGVLCCVLLCCV